MVRCVYIVSVGVFSQDGQNESRREEKPNT